MKKTIFRRRTAFAGAWTAAMMAAVLLMAPLESQAGTVGKAVAIGGHASDLALDEGRGVVYVANYTANRIEVMTLDGNIRTSINVAAQPSSLALSPDGRFLVVAHFGSFTGGSANNGLTILDLSAERRQTYSLGSAPLGVAFGIDGKALVATATEFLLLDPWTGRTEFLGSIEGVTTRTLPIAQVNLPSNIVTASMATSGDGLWIVGSAGIGATAGGGANATTNDTLEFIYEVTTRRVYGVKWTWEPTPGPRAVSVNRDGSRHTSGWAVFDRRMDLAVNQFPGASGKFEIGTHAFDDRRGLVYAQYEDEAAAAAATGGTAARKPTMLVLDADSFAVKERWLLPENTSGKSQLNSDSTVMYSISESGVLILPIGSVNQTPRLVASKQTLSFRGNFCDRRVLAQELTLTDPGGANVDFTLSTTQAGVSISPLSGRTPATVRISVDPTAFQNQKGTVTATVQVATSSGANVPAPIQLLINNREPDQRGSSIQIPGTLVDLLADPSQDRFFVLRQDTNQVLVFDGASQMQIAALKTFNTPTQMAVTFDRRYLLVGHDNAQLIRVYDLETLEESTPIRMPGGHYPRSIAASARGILVASRVAGPIHKMSRVDMLTRQATELPSLGVYENDIHVNTTLVASPNGSSIFAAQADGRVLLYNANTDTFTISRKDFTELSGAYAASSYDMFVVNNTLLNSSLVPVGALGSGSQAISSGFSFVDQYGIRLAADSATSAGIIERVELSGGRSARSSRVAEAPVLPASQTTGGSSSAWRQVFTRTIAPLYSRSAIIALTQSGVTVLPWEFDASTAPPRIDRVVNLADGSGPVAPGSLITIYGANLSPVSQATQQMPLPTALGESCLTVNGLPVPVVYVSSNQINGQLPFQAEGNVTLILRTPGGVSDNYNISVLPTAPTMFRNGIAGNQNDLPAVYRAANGLVVTPTNPVHRGDTLTIFLNGMGRTSPAVETGAPAPDDPAPSVITAPNVTLGGVSLEVQSATLSPGAIGVYQIKARVPSYAPLGLDVPLSISQGNGSSSAATVRVVE